MVDTSVSGIPTLLDLGREVYGAFQTKKDNDEECKDLAGVLESITRQLESLKEITHDQEQNLEQELQSLKEHLKKCKKFIDEHGEKGTLRKIMFHQSEQEELKKLNRKLSQCYQRLHFAMNATLGKNSIERDEKIISNLDRQEDQLEEIRRNQKRQADQLEEIRRNQSQVSPFDKTMFDRE